MAYICIKCVHMLKRVDRQTYGLDHNQHASQMALS